MAVGRELNAVCQSRLEILHERPCVVCRAFPDKPCGYELGIGADRGPRPHVPVAKRALVFFGDVFLLGVAERPDLTVLDGRAGKVAQHAVLVVGSGCAEIEQELTTVFLAAPVMRAVARMLLPSTSEPMTCAHFSVPNQFILTIMLEPSDGIG